MLRVKPKARNLVAWPQESVRAALKGAPGFVTLQGLIKDSFVEDSEGVVRYTRPDGWSLILEKGDFVVYDAQKGSFSCVSEEDLERDYDIV
jgi:hypothetical protein